MGTFRSFIRKNLIILILLLLVYAWYFANHAIHQNPPPNTLGADTGVSVFIQPDTGRQPIIDAIQNAKNEVLVEVYLLSDKQIIQALEDADKRGVRVMAMLEEHPFGGGNLNPKTKLELEKNGVEVSWTSSSYSLTHEKSIVIDGKELFILNQNLTTSAFSKNREYDVLDTEPQDVLAVKQIFEKDWSRDNFYLSSDSNLIVSPLNSRQVLFDLIKNSNSKLDIEIEEIEDPEIVGLIAEKSKKEEVRVIIPTLKQLAANKKAAEIIKTAGGTVKFLSSPYPHAKLILSDDSKAYVGSVNLSKQSMDENRELGIILTEPNSIVTLYSTFEKDWSKAKN